MSSTAVTTIVKMLESLPIEVQDRVAEHLREYIDDLQDELRWNQSFQRTQSKLIAAARRAKQEIAERQGKHIGCGKRTLFIHLYILNVSIVMKTFGL
jgi:glycerate-2-kinase